MLKNMHQKLGSLKFWLRWVIATACGWIAGLVGMFLTNVSLIRCIKASVLLVVPDALSSDGLSAVMQDNIGDGIPANFIDFHHAAFFGALFGILYGAAFGAIGGVSQWLLLRKKISRAYRWMLSNTVGWSAIWGAIWSVQWTSGWAKTFTMTISTSWGLIASVGMGILGWLVLRQDRHNAYVWILATFCSWLLLRTLFMDLRNRMVLGLFFPMSYLWLAFGSASGIITGMGMLWILRQPKRQASNVLHN